MAEQERLEALWSGQFGDEYTTRNADASRGRGPQWQSVLSEWPAKRLLEVGCNLGGNLAHLASETEAWGVDINPNAIAQLVRSVPVRGAGVATARDLPFRDAWFDLTMTVGVLTHQSEDALPGVMGELVRCSSRWVLVAEAASESGDTEEIHYRGHDGAYFRRDYQRLFEQQFPDVRLIRTWFNDEATWDRTTFWVFEKT